LVEDDVSYNNLFYYQRYVIFPIQVLAKSCKPVPVMIMGALMGKKYPLRKYINVFLIVAGVGLFMGGGSSKKKSSSDEEVSSSSQIVGIILLFISLCFDGGTGAYEDKLMAVHSVGPFDLMYNIQLGKTIIAGVALLILNQVHVFLQMCQEMGFILFLLGLTGAMGQVFIFICISKFGALTCSIIGLSRKVTTLVASIYIYGHHLNSVQLLGLVVCIGSMIMNFMGKKSKGGHGKKESIPAEHSKPLDQAPLHYRDETSNKSGDVEMQSYTSNVKPITAGGR
jgi:solute carrier family 35 (UDP-galactose transporter), member B1